MTSTKLFLLGWLILSVLSMAVWSLYAHLAYPPEETVCRTIDEFSRKYLLVVLLLAFLLGVLVGHMFGSGGND